MTFITDLVVLVIVCGLTNAMLGLFLVLRGTSLVSFGLAHSILLGIVVAFLFTNSLNSPLLILGAAITGVMIVILVEFLSESRLIRNDLALGLIYLSVFALGIVLLSRYAQNSSLSLDSVVAGQLIFAPYIRTTFLGINIPTSTWVLSIVLVVNTVFILLFYKELVLSSFDPLFANLIGKSSRKINLMLMSLTSLTIVASYQAIGAILVVAFMITPPATAILFSKNMKILILLTGLISVIGGICGLFLSIYLDVSITGTISVMYGMIFLISLFIAPHSTLRQEFLGKNKELQPPKGFIVEHGGQ